MKKIYIILVIVLAAGSSCKKYLDQKPDRSQAIPSSLRDMRALLNNQAELNNRFAELAGIAGDDYYITSADWSSTSNEEDRDNYIWSPEAEDISCWGNPYKIILHANTVLDNIDKVDLAEAIKAEWNSCRGEALFFRAFAFFDLAQVYAAPFDPQGNNSGPGIPLRLTADIAEISTRSTVQQTYSQIINDLKEAASVLPVAVPVKSRPSRQAVFAALARTFLAMEQYNEALLYADSALQLYNQLIDFNTVNATAAAPFAVFNSEVIFHSNSPGSGLLHLSRCKIDSFVYASYNTNDLRKTVYFKNNNNGTYGFKGSYNAVTNNAFFMGLAVDELYLIKAECLARHGSTAEAMNTLNQLLVKRWRTGTFVPFTAADAEMALHTILTERRKELLFRGLRWQDLRRLNRDARFATQLTRIINGQTYTLPPGDKRYVMLIPDDVIVLTGMPQNPR